MTAVSWALDGVLVLLLLGLAARVVFTRDLFEATVLFIAFGLTLALAWVRLGAVDLALAEAALGAGVTGALLLNAYRRLSDRVERVDGEGEGGVRGAATGWIRGLRWVVGSGIALLGAGLATLLLSLPARDPALPALVAERLEESGVSNPVTGVLLNFRAWDTLLEVGVLVVAMVAVWSMDRGSREFARPEDEAPGRDPVLDALARLAVPAAGVTAVYLVWAGTTASGGAFQGGALLAGAGVLLAAAGILRPVTAATPLVRALAVLGLGLFLLVGLLSMGWTGSLLEYPPGTAYGLIILVEAVLALSIAVILVELFVDVPAVPEADPSLERIDPTGDPLGRAIGLDGALVRGPGDDDR